MGALPKIHYDVNVKTKPTHQTNEKKKVRAKKKKGGWQSLGYKSYLEYKQHLAKEIEENEETTIQQETDTDPS